MQLGLDTLVEDGCQDAATWARFATTEAEAFKSLGANAVGISFPFYTDSSASNRFFGRLSCGPGATFHTPSTTRLAVVIAADESAGLTVLLRPFLDQTNLIARNAMSWRGNIDPSSPLAWFTNYRNALMPYLELAQRLHVARFAISTELGSMANYPDWSSVISAARAVYQGDLVFTFSWVHRKSEVHPANTTPGMDTYPWFNNLDDDAAPSQILADWNRLLSTSDPLPWIANVADDEVGIPARDGAFRTPATAKSLGVFNQRVQADWFTAACDFVKQHHMKGIYFWGSILEDHGGGLLSAPDPALAGEVQPLAQHAIQDCFRT